MSHPPPHPQTSTLWLDRLPPDSLTAIANHLSAAQPDLNLLNLAEVSPTQATAACTALSHTFTAYHAQACQHIPRWASILTSHPPLAVHCVRQPDRLSKCKLSDRDILVALLSSSKLESIAVWGSADFIDAWRVRTNLKRLTLLKAWELSGRELWHALAGMALERLRLGCGCICDTPGCTCPFRDDGGFKDVTDALNAAFRRVKVLDINCGCFEASRVREQAHPVWTVLPQLDGLKGMVVRSKLMGWMETSKDCLEKFRRALWGVQDVSIEHRERQVELAHMLEERVRNVRAMTYYRPLGLEELGKLRGCRRLQALTAVVGEGVERSLDGLIQGWRELETLDIEWWPRTTRRLEPPEHVLWRCRAEPGMVKEIVRAGSSLRDVRMMGIGVSVEEWMEVLELMGRRLRLFGASMQGERDSAVEAMQRVERLLYVAVRCNSELEEFDAVWAGVGRTGIVMVEEKFQAKRTMLAVNRLRQRMPCVNVRGIVKRLEPCL